MVVRQPAVAPFEQEAEVSLLGDLRGFEQATALLDFAAAREPGGEI